MDIRVARLGQMAQTKPILQGIDLEFSAGAVNVVLGPNGAGKSTLLRLLGLLDRPAHGDIYFDGRKLGVMNHAARTRLRRCIGFVFQSPLLLAGSVGENLRFGMRLRGKSADRTAIMQALEKTGLGDKRDQDARGLSGGEKQRLQLARVLVLDPDLYLLDEPTANLDPLSVKNIETTIARLAHDGKTVILATHNLIQARLLAAKMFFLQAGRLVQAGSAQEVLGRPLSLDIAEFSAAENIISGTLTRRGERSALDCGKLVIEVVSERTAGAAAAVIRPEDILVSEKPITSSALNSFRGIIVTLVDLGSVIALSVDCSGIQLTVFVTRYSSEQMKLAVGSSVALTFKATSVHLLPLP
jgi:tungstate transport system ATP-binding protein